MPGEAVKSYSAQLDISMSYETEESVKEMHTQLRRCTPNNNKTPLHAPDSVTENFATQSVQSQCAPDSMYISLQAARLVWATAM